MIKRDAYPYQFDETACKTKCNGLCCKEEGYVYLSETEIESIAGYLKIDKEQFLKLYTKKVFYKKKTALVDLHINGEIRCVFLDDNNRCEIYPVRPKQCREFPFWPHLKNKKKETLKKLCPGIEYAD
jgi:Fe-S-cluster containining protein